MKLKSFLLRFLFCLPFIAIVFYVHSYHGELVNNTEASWQYLRNNEGNVYLAIDAYSPSGIKIDGIFSKGRNVTSFWQLVNYPDWYKGRENFKKLSEFQEVLHPYLPFNKDFNILYTNGWYTFLYEWHPERPVPMPLESSLRIKYLNVSTQNHYNAEHVLGIKVVSELIKNKIDRPAISWQILYPASAAYKYSLNDRLRIVLNNLVAIPDSLEYTLGDLNNAEYSIYVEGKNGDSLDLLIGFVKRDSEGAYQVYTKVNEIEENRETRIDFTEILRHLAAIIFMFYFAIICWFAGLRFVKWRGIVLDNYAAKTLIPIFLGIILLTYLFFIIGILQLLYFPVIFVILLAILFFALEPNSTILSTMKTLLTNEIISLKQKPWRIAFWALFFAMLLYNLSYCFVPAAYPDGSGDIINSYLPNINDYMLSHSFNAPVYNSTNGINSQAIDILRTVAKIFIGEPGVYLLSFLSLILVLGCIYLIGRCFFRVVNALIYLAIILLLSQHLYTEALHLGKTYLSILSLLLVSLYSISLLGHKKNYILPAIFLGFLTSQCPFFIIPFLIYYLLVFTWSFYKYRTIKHPDFNLHLRSFILFCMLSSIFYLKLIIEIGVFFCPGIVDIKLREFFLALNRNNDFYKYIDNNYIRFFYNYHWLVTNPYNLTLLQRLMIVFKSTANIDFAYLLVLIPILLLRINKYKIFYVLEVAAIILTIGILNPTAKRLQIFYIFPLIILQIAVVNDAVFWFKKITKRFLKVKSLFILGGILILSILSYIIFDGFPTRFKFREFIWISPMYAKIDYRQFCPVSEWFFQQVLPTFIGKQSKYAYLSKSYLYPPPNKNFDHCMLIRQYTNTRDTILIVPVRFHSYAMRHITARHALGSVIYQRDISKIMEDLKKLNIGYLSTVPIHYTDYNLFYTPIFENDVFYKYFKLLFTDNGCGFYKIIYDGTNEEYVHTPYNVRGLFFVPMLKEG